MSAQSYWGPFKTKDAIWAHVIERSRKPVYCPLHPAVRGDVCAVDASNASGRVWLTARKLRCRDGQYREFYYYRIGA